MSNLWQKLTLIALVGGSGALARYGMSGLVHRWFGAAFPWGTLAVNLTGCFLFGLIWSMADERLAISGETRLILLVGFCGSFTTFSTYAFETSGMLREGEWVLAAANLLGQNVLGMGCLLLGFAASRWIRG